MKSTDIQKAYIGSTEVEKIYMGSDLIYQNAIDYSKEYFTIEPLADGDLYFSNSGLLTSIDKINWLTLYEPNTRIIMNTGQKRYFKGNLTPSESNPKGIGTFSATANFNVYGNAMSLLYGDNFIGQISLSGKNCAFYALFKNNTYLINADNLILNATTLSERCYQEMFYACSNLTTAPKLPATIISYCCYQDMFNRCTSLPTAPELPAITLTDWCYYGMFYNCSSLNYVKCLALTNGRSSTGYWLTSVSSTGTFVKNPNRTNWSRGQDGIPSGWTVVDAT